ncbi:MAG: prephenate dehydrogenase/arogenate dehydrogenase family protein [bacterium]|nr:prephenate dehydrogenase/arogenate dehydrogenase family protein [bacterium]
MDILGGQAGGMATPHFTRLVIHGVGLLGGSLGMSVRRRGMAGRVVGLGRSPERLEHARRLGAIDELTTRPEAALDGADALVVALPPAQIRAGWRALAPLLRPGMFVTDVGSVKAPIVAQAERDLPKGLLFIGSHPMAGSEKTGVEHGRDDFYEGAACILTPTARTHPDALALATAFWHALGARIVVAPPDRHDRLLAGLSHLPHLVAAALMQTLGRDWASPAELAAIAGNGLRDTTRIAAADPAIWKDIFTQNAPHLLASLDALLDVPQEWRAALDRPEPDTQALGLLYAEGRRARAALDHRPADAE